MARRRTTSEGPGSQAGAEGAAGEAVAGASHNLAEMTIAELAVTEAVPPARPRWQVTRFPVNPEEYARMRQEARTADIQPEGMEAVSDATIDAAPEMGGLDEAPEGEMLPPAAPGPAAPGLVTGFGGSGQTAFQPADNAIAVGPNDVMLAVNADIAVYSRTGVLRFRWPGMSTLFGGVLPSGAALFDPQLAYDHYAQRWIVAAVSKRDTPAGSWVMLAVSKTPDPGAGFWTWALDASKNGTAPTNNWFDYPRLGFDTQGIYITGNMFQFGGGFQYAKLKIFNKAELYGGGTGTNHSIRAYDFFNLKNTDGSMAFTIQPAIHHRGTGGNPAAYMVNGRWPSGSTLTVWTLTNPLGLWTSTAPALSRTEVACRAYDLPPDSLQAGATNRISTADTRLLNAVYQNSGGTQRLWTCHNARHTWPDDDEARCVVQWYEIDIASASVTQDGRYGVKGKYYFYPAIYTDISRNAHLVFGRSAADEFAQLRQSGRRVADAAGQMQSSTLVRGGLSGYTGNRWGDYFGVCRDPSDGACVWMYGMYAEASNTWGTYVALTRY